VFGGTGVRRAGTLRFQVTGPIVDLKNALTFGCVAEIAQ